MRDEWYADNRDVAKWGGIVHLCCETRIANVLQVAYYRKGKLPELRFDNQQIPLPEEVKRCFRDIKEIRRLGKAAGLKIKVITKEFGNRKDYHDYICRCIDAIGERKIIFLDPDNGLEPKGRVKANM